MNYELMRKKLEELLEGDVSTDEKELASRSVDWSLFKIVPDMIVYPKHNEDLEKLVHFVNDHNQKNEQKLTLTARAAGSDMSGGPLNHSIIVDVTRYMNNFIQLQEGDFGTQTHRENFSYPIVGKAKTQTGIYYLAFEDEVAKKNMLMPAYPASRKLAAVGGMVANNGAGERSFRYGQNKDFVDWMKVVLADGRQYELHPLTFSELQLLFGEKNYLSHIAREIYTLIKDNWELIQEKRPRTSKNSAGYLIWEVLQSPSLEDFERGIGFFDLTKLFVGAQGTTGIISEIQYKLVPQENKTKMLVMFVNDIYDLPRIVSLFKKHNLETTEIYDDNTFKIGMKFFKDFIKDKGFLPAIRYTVRFFPEFWMAITGGIPKFIVLGEMVGNDENKLEQETSAVLHDLQKELPQVKSLMIKNKREMQKYIDFRHDSFKLLTEHSKKSRGARLGTRTAPFIDDIAVLPEYLPEYIPRLVAILNEYKDDFVYTIAGHLGDGNFHVVPLVDMFDSKNKERILEISERVYTLALEYKGTITAEHNDGIVRTPFLPQMFGDEMIEVFTRIKNICDPHNIFNPGKKIGMTKDDITKYLA